MLPNEINGVSLQTAVEFGDYPTNTYIIDPVSLQVRGFGDGMEAMRQAVEIIIEVERYKFQIYSPNFGTELSGLIGNDAGFVTSELKRRINDAFFPDNRIIEAKDFNFRLVDTDVLVVSFTASTVYGDFPAGMEVSLK